MKTAYCITLALTGVGGRATDAVALRRDSGVSAAGSSMVVRYTEADIASLEPGALLMIDLTVADTVYVITYARHSILDRVQLVRATDRAVLGQQIPGVREIPDSSLKEIVLFSELTQMHEAVRAAGPDAPRSRQTLKLTLLQ